MITVFTGMWTTSYLPCAGSLGPRKVTLHVPILLLWASQWQHSKFPSPSTRWGHTRCGMLRGVLYASLQLLSHLHGVSLHIQPDSPETPSRELEPTYLNQTWVMNIAVWNIISWPPLDLTCGNWGNSSDLSSCYIHYPNLKTWLQPPNHIILLHNSGWRITLSENSLEDTDYHLSILASNHHGIIFWRRTKQRVCKNKLKQ